MRHHVHALRAVLAAGLLAVLAASSAAQATKGPEGRTLERALALLPQRPTVPIRLIDPDMAADPDAIRRVDAFLIRESDGRIRQVIFLNRRSSVVENAMRGKAIDIAILAAVIRHEQEHLRGADEQQARLAERAFFQGLMLAGHVPVDEAMAYLDVLRKHHRLREGP
jgi:FAD/FMN-containing dehydrogenase